MSASDHHDSTGSEPGSGPESPRKDPLGFPLRSTVALLALEVLVDLLVLPHFDGLVAAGLLGLLPAILALTVLGVVTLWIATHLLHALAQGDPIRLESHWGGLGGGLGGWTISRSLGLLLALGVSAGLMLAVWSGASASAKAVSAALVAEAQKRLAESEEPAADDDDSSGESGDDDSAPDASGSDDDDSAAGVQP